MADDTTTEQETETATTEETSAEATTEETATETTTEQETEAPAETEESEKDALTLDGAKAALAKVRKSEAAMRVRLRETEEKLANAKSPEEVEAVKAQIAADNKAEAQALVVENVALKHGLPDELAAVLKGETREELEAHAKVLAKYTTSPGADPELGGGLDPTTDPDGAYDPAARAKELRAARNMGF